MKKYIGIPYRDRGRDVKTGLDCWGLCRYVSKDHYHQELPKLLYEYETANDAKEMEKAFQASVKNFVRVDHPDSGNIVCIAIYGVPCHVGVYVGNNKFIHTLAGSNSIMESLKAKIWEKRIEGFYCVSV